MNISPAAMVLHYEKVQVHAFKTFIIEKTKKTKAEYFFISEIAISYLVT